LTDGIVLITGGKHYGNDLASAELYDPSTGLWTNAGNMSTARWQNTASTLANGTVLIAGGKDREPLLTSELYDPSTGLWTKTGNMADARYRHTASVLTNGKVLVAGGIDIRPHSLIQM
ncbi:unnamed protein product, partial [Rotaria sp. Silwood1]